MNRWFPWMPAYALAAAALLAVGWPVRGVVDRPRTGIPLSRAAGVSQTVQVRTSLPYLLPDSVKTGWPGLRPSWRLNRAEFTLPPQPMPATERIRMVQVADLIVPGTEPLMDQFVAEMAVVKPQILLVTGDVCYQETEAWYRMMVGYLRRLEDMGIVVIVAPGNHERKGWPLYLRHFGPVVTYRTDVGPLAILTLDSGHGRNQLTPSQMGWLWNELDHLDGRTPVIQIHHPVFPAGEAKHGEAGGSGGYLRSFQRDFVELCTRKGVAIVLSGHWHADAVFDATGRLRDDAVDSPGTRFVVTTTLGSERRRVTRWPQVQYGYRILEFQAGRLVRYTQDMDGDGRPDPIASTPLGLSARLTEFP